MTEPLERHSDHGAALARILFGLILMIDAALKWTTHFRNKFLDHYDEGSEGKASFLHPWLNFWHRMFANDPTRWAWAIAVLETLLAVAVLVGFVRKLTYISGAVFTFILWATAEGFGGPYLGNNADVDVGSGLIYTVVFIMLLILTIDKPDKYSLDAVIERRVLWWHRLAEAD